MTATDPGSPPTPLCVEACPLAVHAGHLEHVRVYRGADDLTPTCTPHRCCPRVKRERKVAPGIWLGRQGFRSCQRCWRSERTSELAAVRVVKVGTLPELAASHCSVLSPPFPHRKDPTGGVADAGGRRLHCSS